MIPHELDDPIFRRYRIDPGGKGFALDKLDPREKACANDRHNAEKKFAQDVEAIVELQNAFYASGKHALLCVLQAMDAGGKDGTVRKVFGPVNPQGIRVTSFKKPTEAELDHDFLWRIHNAVPARGMIGIFNRSHYEDVLVAKVFNLAPKDRIEQRYGQINDFEKMLCENGIVMLKFFLHISPDEQLERFQERLDDPKKHWKFNEADVEVRKRWKDYAEAHETALTRCSTKHAPWFAIPANRNWYRNTMIAHIVRRTLEAIDPKYPPLPEAAHGLKLT
jgi:PPK2 family polyphosphate:nucleotide phosphotransferase